MQGEGSGEADRGQERGGRQWVVRMEVRKGSASASEVGRVEGAHPLGHAEELRHRPWRRVGLEPGDSTRREDKHSVGALSRGE